jgi:hypothetical protein
MFKKIIFGAIIFLGLSTLTASALSVYMPVQGGTGLGGLKAGYIPFGAGTSPFATSTDLSFSGGVFNTKFASTTAVSATQFCFTGSCITNWNSAYTNFNTDFDIRLTATTS